MAERNVDVPKERQMLFRIGINLGDIIHDADKTYGDGINVAARLEPLAAPGGICISAPVREAIFGKLGLPLRDIGEKSLKNIARPVHIYQIQPPDRRARRDWLGRGLRQYRRLAPALGLVLLLAAAAGIGAWRFWPRPATESVYMSTVAVLPFVAAENDPEQSDFARAWRKPDRDLTDYDYFIRARGYLPADTHESLARARQVAEEGLARFPNSPALNLLMAITFIGEQTDLGPFADCHEKFALAWKYENEADKTKSKSRRLEFLHHMDMAKLYTLYAGDFDRSVVEAEAAIEMAPNEAAIRASLASYLSFAGRHEQAIEWASTALRQEHNAANAMFLKPNLAWTLYSAGRYDEAFETIRAARRSRRTGRRRSMCASAASTRPVPSLLTG